MDNVKEHLNSCLPVPNSTGATLTFRLRITNANLLSGQLVEASEKRSRSSRGGGLDPAWLVQPSDECRKLRQV